MAIDHMRNVRFLCNLVFEQPASMSLNDDSYERQPGMTARVCTPIVREIVVVFQWRHSVTVQFPNALLAHARPTMFYIPLVLS